MVPLAGPGRMRLTLCCQGDELHHVLWITTQVMTGGAAEGRIQQRHWTEATLAATTESEYPATER
jgi:hypothetical protein